MSSVGTINFAEASGYKSVPAAIVFAVIYSPLNLWFLMKSCLHPTYVHVVIAVFCAIRVAAFVIRAVMIKIESSGESLGLFITDQVLFGIGYAGLLYSAYTLVLDLAKQAAKRSNGTDEIRIIRLLKNPHLFRGAMTAAVSLGITASCLLKKDGTSPPTATTLREVSTVIFLGLTGLLFFQTLHLARSKSGSMADSFGAKHSTMILMLISLCLLVREIFITATMTPSRHATQVNEHYWYPLVAVPEVVAVVLFLMPGLVPSRKELKATAKDLGYDN